MSNIETRHVCPQCANIELEVSEAQVIADGPSASKAYCPACQWAGPLNEVQLLASSDAMWDLQRTWNLLLVVMHKHGAGPMIQALEFLGYLPRELQAANEDVPEHALEAHNQLAQELRDKVSRAMFEALVTSVITSSTEAWKEWHDKLGDITNLPEPKGMREMLEMNDD